jgi:hypothetical protein
MGVKVMKEDERPVNGFRDAPALVLKMGTRQDGASERQNRESN